jgi:hypothetical protein
VERVFSLINSQRPDERSRLKIETVKVSNNGPNNIPTQPNKHRYQLNFLFFNKSKTVFIRTIFSCRYVTSIKFKMYLFLNQNNLKNSHKFRCQLHVKFKKKLKPTMFFFNKYKLSTRPMKMYNWLRFNVYKAYYYESR